MRLLLAACALLLLSIAGCKAHPKFDLPVYANGMQVSSGGHREDADAIQFHMMLRSPDGLNPIRNFYDEELVKKRGWTKVSNDTWEDGNLVHVGDFGVGGTATPKDPAVPGGWVSIFEFSNHVQIDLWQSVPKKK